jgi:hypothetical protein
MTPRQLDIGDFIVNKGLTLNQHLEIANNRWETHMKKRFKVDKLGWYECEYKYIDSKPIYYKVNVTLIDKEGQCLALNEDGNIAGIFESEGGFIDDESAHYRLVKYIGLEKDTK